MVSQPEFSFDRDRRSAKSSERFARELVDHIVDNDLAAGTRLPIEREMLHQTGVGRTTVREALRLLEMRGLLTIRPGRTGGPFVRRPRPSDLADALSMVLRFENASLGNVMEARLALEPTVARLAAARITDDELDALQASVTRLAGAIEDQRAFLLENEYFHGLLAQASGNAVLRVMVETLHSVIDGTAAGVRYTTKRRIAIMGAHERIVTALRSRDPDASERAMTDHLIDTGRFWRKRYGYLYGRPVGQSNG